MYLLIFVFHLIIDKLIEIRVIVVVEFNLFEPFKILSINKEVLINRDILLFFIF